MKEARAGVAAVPLQSAGRGSIVDYLSLTKPRLNLLVVATSAAGYYLGARGTPAAVPMLLAVGATALVAAGAAALNQVAERDTDALMRRTRVRPIPDGRLAAADARLFGLVVSAAGIALLAADARFAAALIALATLVLYVAVYTPLKRRTPLATLVGAVPGALPPLIGWSAASGGVTAGGLALFAIVFLWQIPHFMAIAWMYRDDFEKAGFPLLSVTDPTGRRAGRDAVVYAAALLPVSLTPALAGVCGGVYVPVALAAGLALLWLAVAFAARPGDAAARRLFLGSIAYLPVIWAVMIATRL
jgi:protoheme IX farnesyltransferase